MSVYALIILALAVAGRLAPREMHTPLRLNILGAIAAAALKFGPAIVGGIQAFRSSRQAGKDSDRARALQDQAVKLTSEEAKRALRAYQANAPLRSAFRTGALNFGDYTNPFARAGASPAQIAEANAGIQQSQGALGKLAAAMGPGGGAAPDTSFMGRFESAARGLVE